jgi:hypothetical protein
MVNYKDSKIYRIVCDKTGQYYIGSTAEKYLSRRLQKHLNNYKEWKNGTRPNKISSFDIFENGAFRIELIENFECSNVYELRKREGEIIKEHLENMLCVNKVIEYGLQKKDNPNWKEEIKPFSKEKMKQYRELNKDKIKEIKKQYRELNKDKIAEHKKQIVICECGENSTSSHLKRHQNTYKHLMRMIDIMFYEK